MLTSLFSLILICTYLVGFGSCEEDPARMSIKDLKDYMARHKLECVDCDHQQLLKAAQDHKFQKNNSSNPNPFHVKNPVDFDNLDAGMEDILKELRDVINKDREDAKLNGYKPKENITNEEISSMMREISQEWGSPKTASSFEKKDDSAVLEDLVANSGNRDNLKDEDPLEALVKKGKRPDNIKVDINPQKIEEALENEPLEEEQINEPFEEKQANEPLEENQINDEKAKSSRYSDYLSAATALASNYMKIAQINGKYYGALGMELGKKYGSKAWDKSKLFGSAALRSSKHYGAKFLANAKNFSYYAYKKARVAAKNGYEAVSSYRKKDKQDEN